MQPLLRAARSSDLPAIYDLLQLAFPEVSRDLFVAQTEQDPTFRYRHARVAEVDGRVVAYVRIFARRMFVRGVPLPAGGIGSVATSPDARRTGYATLLLQDAIRQMEREGRALSFLFTGIPGFYERLGYRIVRQPFFEASRSRIAVRVGGLSPGIRPIVPSDTPELLSIYRRATAGKTGAIVRTPRTWPAAWLGETASFAATDAPGRIFAYIRSRCRDFGVQILEAECLAGAEDAIEELLAAVAQQPCNDDRIYALSPHASVLTRILRAVPSAAETLDFRYPMMLRPIAGRVDDAVFEEPPYFWNSDRI